MFAVKCNRRGENCWFFPCGEPEEIKNFLHQQLDTVKAPLRLCYMRTEDAQMLNREFPNLFSLVATPDDDEYLYDREQQLLLQGKEFRHHRNSLNRLMKKYQIETIEITSENLEQAKVVLDRARENGMENVGTLSTRSTEKIILEHWDALNMNGVIVYADGMPAAIAAGYFISDSMYDISVCRQQCSKEAIDVVEFANVYALTAAGDDIIAQFQCSQLAMQLDGCGVRQLHLDHAALGSEDGGLIYQCFTGGKKFVVVCR
jgi:hypothetical protein